jgi:protein TonB
MFESSLISLDTKKPAGRRWLSLPIAVGLHLAALATFTFAGYWHVEKVADPPASDIYIDVRLPELPAAKINKGGGTPPETQKAQTPAPPRPEVAQPQEKVAKLPTLEPPSNTAITLVDIPVGPGDPRGVDHGDPNGKVDGVEGIPFSGKGPDNGVREAPMIDEPIHVTGAVIKPVFLDGPQPRYTEIARRAGVQGTVILDAIIDENGRVTIRQVLKPLPMGLDQAAVEAVRSWRFKPATLAGRAVKVYFMLTVNFTLQR